MAGFLQEGIGLITHLGPAKVTQFLGNPVFSNHIIMPHKTAEQSNRPVDYTAYIWKGLPPTGIKLWPWNPKTDFIFLSDMMKETGCEANNGIALLKKATYQPLSICSISELSAVVTLRESMLSENNF